MHHLTLGELALAGPAITAVATATVAMAVALTSRRNDHGARLWERRAAAYEFALCQAAWWRELRAETVRTVNLDEFTVTPPESLAASPEWQQSWARLRMYGERDVREAFDRCGDADRQFLLAFMAWRHAAVLSQKVARGDVPSHQAVEGAELVRLRKAVESARDAADATEETFQAVAKAVGRLPSHKRGSWRRSKQSPGV